MKKPRGWWHAEARKMFARGEPVAAIARSFGVTWAAVKYAVSWEERARIDAVVCKHRAEAPERVRQWKRDAYNRKYGVDEEWTEKERARNRDRKRRSRETAK